MFHFIQKNTLNNLDDRKNNATRKGENITVKEEFKNNLIKGIKKGIKTEKNVYRINSLKQYSYEDQSIISCFFIYGII